MFFRIKINQHAKPIYQVKHPSLAEIMERPAVPYLAAEVGHTECRTLRDISKKIMLPARNKHLYHASRLAPVSLEYQFC